MPPNIIKILKDPEYGIVLTEIDDLARDFDKSPNNLTDKQKELRRKYLNIIIKITKKGTDFVKNLFPSPEDKDTELFTNRLNGVVQLIGSILQNPSLQSKTGVITGLNELSATANSQKNKKIAEIDMEQINIKLNTLKQAVNNADLEAFNNLAEMIIDLNNLKNSQTTVTMSPSQYLKQMQISVSKLETMSSKSEKTLTDIIQKISVNIDELITKKTIQSTDLNQIIENLKNLRTVASGLPLGVIEPIKPVIIELNQLIFKLENDLMVLENFDAGVNTVKRIAELLMLEIDPTPCVIPPCVIPLCNEKKYMTSTAILSIIVGIIGIISVIIIMMFFRNKR
jgi:hypothetical protein